MPTDPLSPVFGIFLDAVHDLRCRSGLRANAYDVSQAAGIMRRLLIDSRATLLDQVKRKTNFDPRFHPGQAELNHNGGGLQIDLRGLYVDRFSYAAFDDPRGLAKEDPRIVLPHTSLTKGQFLGLQVAREVVDAGPVDRKRVVTVQDLITLYANKLGGVHVEADIKPDGTLLADLLQREDYARYMRDTVAALGRVVVEALHPLEQVLAWAVRTDSYGAVSVPLQKDPPIDGAS